MEKQLPKNICQIGYPDGDRKILIEEYVISYLQEVLRNKKEPQIIVLFGDGYEQGGIRYYFLKGAASHRASGDSMRKMDEFYFQTIGKQYFPQMKGIGWSCAGEGTDEILELLHDMHEQNFHGIEGYYIYFEKNEGMEEYMLHRRQRDKNDAGDAVTAKRRNGKKRSHASGQPTASPKRPAPMAAVQILNMVSLCILIICCIIAVTTLNQYDKMKQLEETVIYLEDSMEEQKNLPDE